MIPVKPAIHAGIPILGAAAWTFAQPRVIPAVEAMILAVALAAALGSWYFTRRRQALPLKLGIQTAALWLAVLASWSWSIGPLLSHPAGFDDWMTERSGLGLFLALSPITALVLLYVQMDSVLAATARWRGRDRRRPSGSDLYGKARLLGPQHIRELGQRSGILLGQRGSGPRAPLIGWRIEGSAITVAPPRTGKGATIALNFLDPDFRGFRGSTVLVDPRGETFCIVARRRRELGRRVVLLDPFGLAAAHHANFGDEISLPDHISARYNPLDFIRDETSLAVRDINVLLDAILTPPQDDRGNSRHFYESARSIIGGYIAWVKFGGIDLPRNLETVFRLLSQTKEQREDLAAAIRNAPRELCNGMAHLAIEREERVGKEEGGSNFTTIVNQLGFMIYPEMVSHTSGSDFDPIDLANGDVDIFVVAPEELLDSVKGWIRLWITIPNAVAGIQPLQRDMLIVIDEMPRLGLLKPVMDGYNMAAGKGIHFWCFAQSLQGLDSTWGKDHRKTLTELAEVVQILGHPRIGAEAAEELSKAIGTASFESRSESASGSTTGARILAPASQTNQSEQLSVVRERLVTPDDLMTMGPNEQYVIAAAKDMPRDAIHLNHARYWQRPDARSHAGQNPFVIRKQASVSDPRVTLESQERPRQPWKLPTLPTWKDLRWPLRRKSAAPT